MPAVTVDDVLALPRIVAPDPLHATDRPVLARTTAPAGLEGEGFPVRRAFAGIDLRALDPFIHMDQMGEIDYAPGEPKGTAWHPHRGFETVTYMIDGVMRHQDSHGGGGLITSGDTQWMTAGSGLLHIEAPPEEVVLAGGLFHGFQLWVNLPRTLKMTDPRYQDIEAAKVTLLSSEDGGTLVRLIAGSVAGHDGPGVTHSPITLIHATLAAGAELRLPWRPDFNALVYGISGAGSVGRRAGPPRVGSAGGSRGRRRGHRRRRRPAGQPDGRVRRARARWAAHPRADRDLRPVRHEHPRRDRHGVRGLPGRASRRRPRERLRRLRHRHCSSGSASRSA